MNYYIKGDAANADKIKAAFEAKGFIPRIAPMYYGSESVLFFTCTDNYIYETPSPWVMNIIKTHPDYKELELPVQPNFKVGDWLVYKNGDCFAGCLSEAQVVKVEKGMYFFASGTTGSCKFIDVNCRLWTIADAKDGDVLIDTLSGTRAITILFRFINEDDSISAYCGWNGYTFRVTIDGLGYGTLSSTQYVPATAEQRDLLFQKMKEEGYVWNDEKKELKKIQPHYNISNFKPFDKVLVRCSNDEEWMIEFYCKYDTLVHTSPHRDYPFMGIGDSYSQCIPFNDDTKHLLGTTDMCDEQYINW